MKTTDSEPQGVGMELEQYRTWLEQMVEEKSKDLIAIQENLEATNRRQALFIKVLQILQLEPDIPTAMNMALAEIGRYTGVDRLATWENHLDGVTYGCTNEWCNEGIEPAIDYLRSMTIEAGKPWFDMLEENHIICTSDIYSLDPFITQMLEVQGVKAIAVFPLSQLGVHFGFLSFNFCWKKQWDKKDVELMSQISQIVSTATKRWQVEISLQQSQRTMQKVLDNINANTPDASMAKKLATLTAPFICLDGMNEKGVSIAVLTLDSDPTYQQTGKPMIATTLAIRLVLDRAATTAEAVELLSKYDMFASSGRDYHFYITDASGDGRVLEYDCNDPTRPLTVTPSRSVTNFFVMYKDNVLPNQRNGVYGHGRERYDAIEEILDANAGSIDREIAWQALQAASQAPNPQDVTSNTQWSILYDNTALTAEAVIRRDWNTKTSYDLVSNVAVTDVG